MKAITQKSPSMSFLPSLPPFSFGFPFLLILSIQRAESIFQKVRQTFGMHSRLLVVNSLKHPSADAYPSNLWDYLDLNLPKVEEGSRPQEPDSSESFHPLEEAEAEQAPPKRGKYLSSKDIDGMSVFVKDFVTQSLVPFMEKNIIHWNETVATPRKGLAGRFFMVGKKYFGSSGKSQNTIQGPNGLPTYPYTSPEAQLRKMADFAFMLQDYRNALTIYEMVKKDFASDKVIKHLAGAMVFFFFFFLFLALFLLFVALLLLLLLFILF